MGVERDDSPLAEALRRAVGGLVAPGTAAAGIESLPAFIEATSALPLSGLPFWDQVIRGELIHLSYQQSGYLLDAAAANAVLNRALTWADLCSWNGYARERTLRALAGPSPNSFLLAVVAYRLNDWVPQVRAAAGEAFRRMALVSEPEQVVDVLCTLLPAWTRWGRAQVADKSVLLAPLSNPNVAKALERRVIESPAGPVVSVLSQALRTSAMDEPLPRIAAEAVQPAVRAKTYRALLLGKAMWVDTWRWQQYTRWHAGGRLTAELGERPLSIAPPLRAMLNAAAEDRSSLVRRVAAEALIRELSQLGQDAAPLAQRFAVDPSPPVAERGRFALQRIASC